MRRIHWVSIILLLFHVGGCASDGSLHEPQNVVVKKGSKDERVKLFPEKKGSDPLVGGLWEEELYEKAAVNLSEETSQPMSRNDAKLTMNPQSMLPSSETKSASQSSDLSSPETESLEMLMEKGRAYVSEGDHEMAFAAFDRLVGLSNDALSYYYRGYASIKLHRYKEAISDFSQAVQLSPEFDTRQHQGKSSLAYETLRDSYRERAFAYFQLNRSRLALADISKYLEMSAGDQVVLTDEYVLRGRVYTALEQTELAITDFSEALRSSSASRSQAHIYYLRGLSFFRIKKVQLGLQDIDQSCRLRFEKACAFFQQIQ